MGFGRAMKSEGATIPATWCNIDFVISDTVADCTGLLYLPKATEGCQRPPKATEGRCA